MTVTDCPACTVAGLTLRVGLLHDAAATAGPAGCAVLEAGAAAVVEGALLVPVLLVAVLLVAGLLVAVLLVAGLLAGAGEVLLGSGFFAAVVLLLPL